jgi:hypothetical protein
MKDRTSNNSTKNMFIESCWELKLNLSEDLTVKTITEAFQKIVSFHTSAIQKGIKPPFEMQIKIQAMEYLLSRINSK